MTPMNNHLLPGINFWAIALSSAVTDILASICAVLTRFRLLLLLPLFLGGSMLWLRLLT